MAAPSSTSSALFTAPTTSLPPLAKRPTNPFTNPEAFTHVMLNNTKIYVRKCDHWWCATNISSTAATAKNYTLASFLKAKSRQEEFNALLKELNSRPTEVIQFVNEGNANPLKTWVHPQVAIIWGAWINAGFRREIVKLVARHTGGDSTLAAETLGNADALNNTTTRVLVQTVQNNPVPRPPTTDIFTEQEEILKQREAPKTNERTNEVPCAPLVPKDTVLPLPVLDLNCPEQLEEPQSSPSVAPPSPNNNREFGLGEKSALEILNEEQQQNNNNREGHLILKRKRDREEKKEETPKHLKFSPQKQAIFATYLMGRNWNALTEENREILKRVISNDESLPLPANGELEILLNEGPEMVQEDGATQVEQIWLKLDFKILFVSEFKKIIVKSPPSAPNNNAVVPPAKEAKLEGSENNNNSNRERIEFHEAVLQTLEMVAKVDEAKLSNEQKHLLKECLLDKVLGPANKRQRREL